MAIEELPAPTRHYRHALDVDATIEPTSPSHYSVHRMLDSLDIRGCGYCRDLRDALIAWLKTHPPVVEHRHG